MTASLTRKEVAGRASHFSQRNPLATERLSCESVGPAPCDRGVRTGTPLRALRAGVEVVTALNVLRWHLFIRFGGIFIVVDESKPMANHVFGVRSVGGPGVLLSNAKERLTQGAQFGRVGLVGLLEVGGLAA